MNKTQFPLRYVFGLLLMIVCCVSFAHAQPPAGTPSSSSGERRRPAGDPRLYDRGVVERAIEQQPSNSVLVRIRFRKEYGYKSESAQGGAGLGSCDVFSVSLAKPARPAEANVLIPVRRPDKISEVHGYYFCEFLVSGLALDQEVSIGASVDDQGPWLGGGTHSQVPANYQRVLTDRERSVRLTPSDPRATMNFEVMFEPKRAFIDTRRPSDLIRAQP